MFHNRDMLLAGIAGSAYAGYMSMRITLHIDGMIITGKLISQQAYLDGVQDMLAYEGSLGTTLVANLFRDVNQANEAKSVPDDELVNVPIVFLQDAIVHYGPQQGLWLGWWRARVDSIVGWGWEPPHELRIEDDGADL